MSYDAYLRCPCCREYPEKFHPTYNLTAIFHLALSGVPVPDARAGTFEGVILGQRTREPCGLELLNGHTGGDSIPMLEQALARMADPARLEEFRKLEPANGWGDLDGAVRVIGRMLERAREYPKHAWEVR